jgi:hypothetical protein
MMLRHLNLLKTDHGSLNKLYPNVRREKERSLRFGHKLLLLLLQRGMEEAQRRSWSMAKWCAESLRLR